MPDMTGLGLAAQLHADGNAIPIMLITGAASSDIGDRAAALSIARVLAKPPEEDEVLEFINGVIPSGAV